MSHLVDVISAKEPRYILKFSWNLLLKAAIRRNPALIDEEGENYESLGVVFEGREEIAIVILK